MRHIVWLTGSAESYALAIYMKDVTPDYELVFCDSGKELPETYEYIDRLEAFLGRKLVQLGGKTRFDDLLKVHNGRLPSPAFPWCHREIHTKPLEAYIGKDQARFYSGLCADQDNERYRPVKANVEVIYPFRDAGMTRMQAFQCLEQAGLGLPGWLTWRSHPGCFFCFFQRKADWVRLLCQHPDLFEQAKQYEKTGLAPGPGRTWCRGESLAELSQPQRMQKILTDEQGRAHLERTRGKWRDWVFAELSADDEDSEGPCLICTL